MISEQGEMIDRLDDNLDAAEVNVNMGYQEIVKYGQNVYVYYEGRYEQVQQQKPHYEALCSFDILHYFLPYILGLTCLYSFFFLCLLDCLYGCQL